MPLKKLSILLLAAALSACSAEKPSPEGVWLEPVPGMPGKVQGFDLQKDGKAASVNMATLQYESWEKDGNTLTLRGKSLGNHQTISFTETLHIEQLTNETLIIKDGDATRTYHRPSRP